MSWCDKTKPDRVFVDGEDDLGIVVVAALAANAEAVPVAAVITATWRRTNSARQRRQSIDLIVGPAVYQRERNSRRCR